MMSVKVRITKQSNGIKYYTTNVARGQNKNTVDWEAREAQKLLEVFYRQTINCGSEDLIKITINARNPGKSTKIPKTQ